MPPAPVGSTQAFVLGQGFQPVGNHAALIAHDGSLRLFAEVSANPDRVEARAREAYQTLLASMQPGWSLRVLQVYWPDPSPRQEFERQVRGWKKPENEGAEVLRQGLLIFVQEHSLPFTRRTILEFSYPGQEGLAWWEGLPGLFQAYGLCLHFLPAAEIQKLAYQICNPDLRS